MPRTIARPKRRTDMRAAVRAVATVTPNSSAASPAESAQRRRHLVADLCKLLGREHAAKPPASPTDRPGTIDRILPAGAPLSPRLRQTLDRLLAGDSEKQIALHLDLSRHTVHIYVKALYRAFDVNSRGELLAKFVGR